MAWKQSLVTVVAVMAAIPPGAVACGALSRERRNRAARQRTGQVATAGTVRPGR